MPTQVITNPVSGVQTRYPKYPLTNVTWVGMDYGVRPVYLYAVNATNAQHNGLAAQPDVDQFPADLDLYVGPNRQLVEDKLEAKGLPGSWVRAKMRYRLVLRVIAGSCMLANAFRKISDAAGANNDILPQGVTLSTPYSEMPQGYRNRVVQAAQAIKVDISSLDSSSTLRDLLRLVGQKARPKAMLGIELS